MVLIMYSLVHTHTHTHTKGSDNVRTHSLTHSHTHTHTHTHTHIHSYYPLVPPYRKEEACPQVKPESNSSEDANDVPRPPNEACEVNLDYVQAFEEQHASLPARPDILLLPSDLRPFVKVCLIYCDGSDGVRHL